MTALLPELCRADKSPSREMRLLVFSDDWGRHPSSCQHLIGELLPRYRVDWVNTIGMRRPSLSGATVRRGLEKVRDWTKSPDKPQQLPRNLKVLTPLMWPWFRRSWDRAVNRRLLTSRLQRHIDAVGQPVVAVTTIPIVADLMSSLRVDRWVYYCVDDFSKWPGLDNRTLDVMERELIGRADRLIAASETLCDRIDGIRGSAEAVVLNHGVDLVHWRQPARPHVVSPVSAAERPRVVFWGLIDQRLDVEFLRVLSDSLPAGTIALVGPEDRPPPALNNISRIVRYPPVPYSQLPALAIDADVLIMPYADLPVTRAMQPLKLLEYLATNKPVVVRDLPATRPWRDCLDIAASPETFAATVLKRLSNGLPPNQRHCRERLQDESWSAKAAAFEQYVTG